MDTEYVLMLVARWLHILSATLAIGVPLYVRFVLMPALGTLDEANRSRLQEAIAKRWRMIVHILIVVFLATGLYTFLGIARWKTFSQEAKMQYHALFGVKFLIALAMFTISSALAGRSGFFAPIRQNPRPWLQVLILLGLLIIGISGIMRFMDPPARALLP